MAKKRKRLVIGSDMHAGHRVGLTPPEYQSAIVGKKFYHAQVELLNEYKRMCKALSPVDVFVHNGDAIDGTGSRSGGTELLTTDRNRQVDIAIDCFREMKAKKTILVRGTPYHTGDGETFEDRIASEINADKVGDHEWLDINGVIFDIKHKVGGSSIPHGKFTPLAKDRLWNFLWTEHNNQPKAQVIIRSHVHYFCYCGEESWLAMTTPALQGMGSKYGAQQCSGIVHFGLVWFDIDKDGSFEWGADICHVESQQARVIKI
ncbi:MAG: hypothetical protein KKC77_19340 [Proteobacteria bacterium]|nr:hypothetical protein [Pseudomonadota bacterium]